MTAKNRLITTAFISGVVAATLVFTIVDRMRSPADALDNIRLLPSASAAPADAVNSGSGHEEAFRRLNYYPNTEELDPKEMRVIALGTGTPNFRRSQASGCWLVELGDGKKFIFDMGTGSLANLAALEIPYTFLDKVFISHLHVDHIGDLDAMFIGG